MNSRGIAVLIYIDEQDAVHCRACCGIYDSIHRKVCGNHIHRYMNRNCYSHLNGNIQTQGFKYDNTKHKLILAKGTCKLCTTCITPCPNDIDTEIETFISKIDTIPLDNSD